MERAVPPPVAGDAEDAVSPQAADAATRWLASGRNNGDGKEGGDDRRRAMAESGHPKP